MPKIYRKDCDYCGRYYEKPAKRFCSLKCASKYSSKYPNKGCFKKGHKLNLKPPIFKDCLYCHKRFKVSRKNPTTKYCCHRCSVDNLITGKPRSEETKKKISKNNARYWANHRMSDEHIKKAIKALKPYQSGKNHWNWKGGITPILKKLRMVPAYNRWRKEVFERDNYTCQKCQKVGGRLRAHHIVPFAKLIYKKNWKLLWDINNGTTLCLDCHYLTDSYARRYLNLKEGGEKVSLYLN